MRQHAEAAKNWPECPVGGIQKEHICRLYAILDTVDSRPLGDCLLSRSRSSYRHGRIYL